MTLSRSLFVLCVATACGGSELARVSETQSTGTTAALATPGVTITSPAAGASVGNPVTVVATAQENVPISQMQVWDNGTKLGWYAGASVNQSYTLATGNHALTVLDLDDTYQVLHKTLVNFEVAAQVGVVITSPTPGEAVTGPVLVKATAAENQTISQVQVWDNGNKLGAYAGSTVDQSYVLSAGAHQVTVTDLDSNYQLIHQTTVSYTVEGGTGQGVGPHGGTVSLLHFGLTGDTRPGTSEAQGVLDYPSPVIDAIATQLRNRGSQFVIDLGDHMNNWHVLSAAQEMMAKYQHAMSLFGGTWFMTMGNHECDVSYPILCLPFAGEAGSNAVNFTTFLDALKETGVSALPWYTFDVHTSLGIARFVVIATNSWCPEQQSWLESTLAAADTQAKYTFILRHHPPDDGGAPAEISDIVRQHKFALYLTGHAHMYQHLTTDSGRDVILGTGGAPLQNVSGIPGAKAFNGYAMVDQQSDGQLQVTIYDSSTDTQVDAFKVGPN